MTGKEDRALARELWERGYSLRYIARSLGVGGRTAEMLIGRKMLSQREPWRLMPNADKPSSA